MIYVVRNKTNRHYLPDRAVFIPKNSPDIDKFGFAKQLDNANVYYNIKSANNAINNAIGQYIIDEQKVLLGKEELEIKQVKLIMEK